MKRTKAQKDKAREWDKNFFIRHNLPTEQTRVYGDSMQRRKAALDAHEERRQRDQMREVWE